MEWFCCEIKRHAPRKRNHLISEGGKAMFHKKNMTRMGG